MRLCGNCMISKFQSSPGTEAGSYRLATYLQVFDRGFQSSPGTEAGSYKFKVKYLPYEITFQSSPGTEAGSYTREVTDDRRNSCFNPLPAQKPGATLPPAECRRIRAVSILSRHRSRELPISSVIKVTPSKFQSSPGTEAGSYWHRKLAILIRVAVSILSRHRSRELRQTLSPRGRSQ